MIDLRPKFQVVAIACFVGCVAIVTVRLVGCSVSSSPVLTGEPSIQFEDEVTSNREETSVLDDMEFVNSYGEAVRLEAYRGRKNVLLVFTRGFSGTLCAFCTTQTSRLIANYSEFTDRETEILLVYPGSRMQLPEFQAASVEESGRDSFPFPVLLDEDLAAVKKLDIAASLAHPSTFLIDKAGQVRLAYVGTSAADRPSIQALLDQIDAIQGD